MKAKNYLEKIKGYDARIRSKVEELNIERELYKGMDPEDLKATNYEDNIINLIKEINNCEDEKRRIISLIERLPANEAEVLHKRYVQRLPFKVIGLDMGKDESWATTTHGRALQRLQEVLDYE